MLQKLLKQYLLEHGTTMLKPVDGVREIMCLLAVMSSKPPTGGEKIAAVPILHLAICKSR
jgi:hypothetical protein